MGRLCQVGHARSWGPINSFGWGKSLGFSGTQHWMQSRLRAWRWRANIWTWQPPDVVFCGQTSNISANTWKPIKILPIRPPQVYRVHRTFQIFPSSGAEKTPQARASRWRTERAGKKIKGTFQLVLLSLAHSLEARIHKRFPKWSGRTSFSIILREKYQTILTCGDSAGSGKSN